MEIKKRLDAFIDAVIAIILTIMVLELPINLIHGQVDYATLAKSVGVYVVSFFFVANIWYQHALIFSTIDKVNRNLVVWDVLLMLPLSLVPTATRIMTTVEDNYSVMLYGAIYLVVTLMMNSIIGRIIHMRFTSEADMRKMYGAIYSKHNAANGMLMLANIVLAYFLPRVSMVLFIVLTIQSFFDHNSDEAQIEELTKLDSDGKDNYLKMDGKQQREFTKDLRAYDSSLSDANLSDEERQAKRAEYAQQIQARFGFTPNKEWLAEMQAKRDQFQHTQDAQKDGLTGDPRMAMLTANSSAAKDQPRDVTPTAGSVGIPNSFGPAPAAFPKAQPTHKRRKHYPKQGRRK